MLLPEGTSSKNEPGFWSAFRSINIAALGSGSFSPFLQDEKVSFSSSVCGCSSEASSQFSIERVFPSFSLNVTFVFLRSSISCVCVLLWKTVFNPTSFREQFFQPTTDWPECSGWLSEIFMVFNYSNRIRPQISRCGRLPAQNNLPSRGPAAAAGRKCSCGEGWCWPDFYFLKKELIEKTIFQKQIFIAKKIISENLSQTKPTDELRPGKISRILWEAIGREGHAWLTLKFHFPQTGQASSNGSKLLTNFQRRPQILPICPNY